MLFLDTLPRGRTTTTKLDLPLAATWLSSHSLVVPPVAPGAGRVFVADLQAAVLDAVVTARAVGNGSPQPPEESAIYIQLYNLIRVYVEIDAQQFIWLRLVTTLQTNNREIASNSIRRAASARIGEAARRYKLKLSLRCSTPAPAQARVYTYTRERVASLKNFLKLARAPLFRCKLCRRRRREFPTKRCALADTRARRRASRLARTMYSKRKREKKRNYKYSHSRTKKKGERKTIYVAPQSLI
ncbi:unnamed protein product, partial [Trichogramma brassicae]